MRTTHTTPYGHVHPTTIPHHPEPNPKTTKPNSFGDLAPSSEAGKGFTIVFALLGVSLVALSVGEISAYLIEKHDEQVWVCECVGSGMAVLVYLDPKKEQH